VAAFVEKPAADKARGFVASGRYLWNSGMFVWRVDGIHAEMRAHLPALAAHVDELTALAAAGPEAWAADLGTLWARIGVRTTIDYGVMERSTRAVCLPAAFTWTDVGSWAALARVLADAAADAAGNVHLGSDIVAMDTQNSLIVARGGRLVAAVGLRDLAVVDTEDALLICSLDQAQGVREVVARLTADGRTHLL
jgi:mannose-1-phosphate guanylyltransferase